MFYLIKIPRIVRKIYSKSVWRKALNNKVLYLSFDDGPHPLITNKVLDELKKNDAKATFFCIGDNVVKHPDTYKRIIEEGHSIGNHTYNHLNGWKTNDLDYLENVKKAAEVIDSRLFRPPYGRIRYSQRKKLMHGELQMEIIMWTVLSGDFDKNTTPERCFRNVVRHSKPGSIIVFHDSEKARERMLFALPRVLKYFSQRGFRFEGL